MIQLPLWLPVLFLAGTCVAVLLLILSGMRRMRRGQLLRLLASLARRELPLETSLLDIAGTKQPWGPEILCRQLAWRLEAGRSLASALLEMKVLNREQSVALELAALRGRAAEILDALAAQTRMIEHHALWAGTLTVYPLLVGLLLAAVATFKSVFIEPKFEQMFREMELLQQFPWDHDLCMACAYILLGWGVVLNVLIVPVVRMPWLSRVPLVGRHLWMEDESRFAHALGLALESGATLEESVGAFAEAPGRLAFGARMGEIRAELLRGTAPVDAFRAHGPWRSEFLWGLDAVIHGAAPGPTFQQLATVLEEKASGHFKRICRVGTPLALLVAATGVGVTSWATVHAVYDLARVSVP